MNPPPRAHGDNVHSASPRLRLFGLCHRAFLRFVSAASIIHEGFWLGLLSREELTELTMESYSTSDTYSVQEYNLSGFFPWEKAALDRFFSGHARFLIAGAGAGREMIALSKEGKHA